MKRFIELMRAPGIYVRMLYVALVFFILSWIHYGNISTSIYYSVLCVALMQIGYVGGVLFLIWKEERDRRAR